MPASEPELPGDALLYRLEYSIAAEPLDGSVAVTLNLKQRRDLLRELSFRADPRIYDIEADGELIDADGRVRWLPPEKGGSLRWRARVAHRRNGHNYDAWLGPEWGLFRAEDVIPRAATRTLRGAHSETWLEFALPRKWSAVTQYFGRQSRFRVDNPERRFDQPSGWMVIGDLGVRRETIAGTSVAVAGPTGQAIRRLEMLALLNWTLPDLARLLPELPPRLTIISAGEPMWRGGLSAPQSLYLHAERPLISENATSALLHEVLHIALGLKAVAGYDWVVEGLAEYYSLELLHRSGTISTPRYRQARSDLAEWSQDADTLCRSVSTGPTTALAVTLLAELDAEIRDKSDGAASLDDLTRLLWRQSEAIDHVMLVRLAETVAGGKSDTLHIDRLRGCRTISAALHAD